ncbi:MAG: mycofactocin biosynthesis peptidyl-dipeptidase MftE [Geodermatophilaceae bacterium]|nr:mycofactocin biosynthesis peptidyl-dipeptidase MftE [Geodermatophilaceae bacterium]MDQ3466308.1 mycofactocin biosynthesis peptidyl-dipeptidase MftE [Actinomycetota bacterium]
MRALDAAPWPAVQNPAAAVVVPLGSTEQHGHHLPFDTDTAVAGELARRLVAARPELVLAPPLAYGASGEHEGFPGTLSMGCEALELVLLELGRSASRWAGRLLVVNGHGGNLAPLDAAVRRLRSEAHDAAYWSPQVPGGDAHAGRTETSLMLALRPAAVLTGRAVAGSTVPLPDLLPQIRASSIKAVSPSGVLGDPADASAGEGGALLDALLVDLDHAVGRWLAGGTGGRLNMTPKQE